MPIIRPVCAELPLLLCSTFIYAQNPAPQYPNYPSETPEHLKPVTSSFNFERREAMIPMRDGVHLHTVILVPKGASHAPIPLTRTPYSADELTTHSASAHLAPNLYGYYNAVDVIVDGGYIRVIQDIRGKYGSEGDYVMNRPNSGPIRPWTRYSRRTSPKKASRYPSSSFTRSGIRRTSTAHPPSTRPSSLSPMTMTTLSVKPGSSFIMQVAAVVAVRNCRRISFHRLTLHSSRPSRFRRLENPFDGTCDGDVSKWLLDSGEADVPIWLAGNRSLDYETRKATE
jgi:hypothetical protein